MAHARDDVFLNEGRSVSTPDQVTLASIFGNIAASSAASIVWAFISPYAASEVSSLDFFNLLWAAVANLRSAFAGLVRRIRG